MSISMRSPRRALLAALVTAAALLATLVMPAAEADAAKLTACVKKKTGAMKLVTGKKAKKKCPKGWRKVTWNTRGPRGPQGPAGPQLMLKDATGAIVGKFLGVYPSGGTIYIVERDGGQYVYFGSGTLYPTGSPSYTTADCSDTARLTSSSGVAYTEMVLKLIGGPFRFVFRTSTGGLFGPAMAWKSSGTYESVVTAPLYRMNGSTGVCELDDPAFTGELIALDPVPAPPDFVGPLVIG
jgi:hypothetical protein